MCGGSVWENQAWRPFSSPDRRGAGTANDIELRSAVRTNQPSPSSGDAEAEALSSARRRAVVRAVQTLPEREQRLIELRFGFNGEQHSLATVGRKLGITRERARQLEREALTKLERALATTALGESHRASAEPLRAA
jgi:RNA polymerase sigma factor (sigma-70 family)